MIIAQTSLIMKRIYLIRHAKTERISATGDDFSRKLTDRGKLDAKNISAKLEAKGCIPELLISSPAARAKKTCRIFSKIFNIPENDILYVDDLYMAKASVYAKIISRISDEFSSVAIFSHNPGITEYAGSIMENVRIDHMPTSSVFVFECLTNKWSAFESAEKRFLIFEYPLP